MVLKRHKREWKILHRCIKRQHFGKVFCPTFRICAIFMMTIVVFCASPRIYALSYPMTKHTKALYEMILKEYQWDAIRQVSAEDVTAFESTMQKAESELLCSPDSTQGDCRVGINMAQAIQLLNLNAKDKDKYWEIEKGIIEQKYKNQISKINVIQKGLLFNNLKKAWKDDFQTFRYKYALLIYTNMINDYQLKLKKSQEENQGIIDNTKKLKDSDIQYFEKENKQLDKEIETTKQRIAKELEDIQRLEYQQTQILNNINAISE